MIPENKLPAVQKAMQTAFNTDRYDDILQLTKGLSSALIFKIIVRGNPYLLRVITRTDAMGDPSFYYKCMQVAAGHGIAPRVHYMSVEDRISITDFIVEQPFSIVTAKQVMPDLLRQLHALPKFAVRNNYFELMDKLVTRFIAAEIFPSTETNEWHAIYKAIMQVYPWQEVQHWVSCHNDTKPENIVFDGQRAWLVDWESAFANDRYLDIAIVANFLVTSEQEEINYLENYFGEPVSDYVSARFFLMQQLLHYYYFTFLMLFDAGDKPIVMHEIALKDFRGFHDNIWSGKISLANNQAKREYAMLHLEQFKLNVATERFRESMHILKHAVAHT